jgi:hypothetical protein
LTGLGSVQYLGSSYLKDFGLDMHRTRSTVLYRTLLPYVFLRIWAKKGTTTVHGVVSYSKDFDRIKELRIVVHVYSYP